MHDIASTKDSRHCVRMKRSPAVALLMNLAVFAAILLAAEVTARLLQSPPSSEPSALLKNPAADNASLDFQPYVMFVSTPGTFDFHFTDLAGNAHTSRISTNNYGFTNRQDFDLTKPYRKALNEKVVLLTGASPVWGYGATGNATIVHERIAALLNGAQDAVHYTVVSLAMRGWIAQQEAVALDLWGRLYEPDWIITMDGFDDAGAGCKFSQGTGNPVLTSIMRLQLQPGYFDATHRNGLEEKLLQFSALYRALTGKTPLKTSGRQYITDDIFVDPGMGSQQPAFTRTPFADVRKQLAFYLLAQQSMIDRYPKAKYLVTSEARSAELKSIFGDYINHPDDRVREESFAAAADAWLSGFGMLDHDCSEKNGQIAMTYMLEMEPLRLQQLVRHYRKNGRAEVEYYNTGLLFPREPEKRRSFFIDDVHLNDTGHDLLARYYSYRILSRDFPDRDWAEMRPE
jgi:hypothetical protein